MSPGRTSAKLKAQNASYTHSLCHFWSVLSGCCSCFTFTLLSVIWSCMKWREMSWLIAESYKWLGRWVHNPKLVAPLHGCYCIDSGFKWCHQRESSSCMWDVLALLCTMGKSSICLNSCLWVTSDRKRTLSSVFFFYLISIHKKEKKTGCQSEKCWLLDLIILQAINP